MYLDVAFTARDFHIPKGCRKARLMDFARHHTIQIREVSADEAPIALIETPMITSLQALRLRRSSVLEAPSFPPRTYRWYDAQLWIPMDAKQVAAFNAVLNDPTSPPFGFPSFNRATSEILQDLDDWACQRVIVNNVPHICAEEPYYHIRADTTSAFTAVELRVEYRSSLTDRPTRASFPVIQAEQALARARAVHALVLDDSLRDLGAPELPAVFEVRLPEAIQHNFNPSAQTPTRVQVEMKYTIRAEQAWADEDQGFVLTDGRSVVPHLGFAFIDEINNCLTPISSDIADTLGFFATPAEYGAYWQRDVER